MEKLLDTVEVARVLGIHPATLATWRSQGRGPEFLKVGPRKVRYRVRDLDTWLDRNRRTSTRVPQ